MPGSRQERCPIRRLKGPLAAALAGWLAALSAWPAAVAGDTPQSTPQSGVAILQLRALQGEGAVVGAGMRSSRGIVMQVTDETGRPVEGVAVSFHLPSDGPSGLFLSGLKTEIAMTGPDGRASVYGIQWNNVAGPAQVRVTAAKGEARAGIIVNLYVSEKAVAEERAPRDRDLPKPGGSKKWLLFVLVAAGVGGGAALGLSQSKQGASPGGSVVPPAASTAAPSIGAPQISVGKP